MLFPYLMLLYALYKAQDLGLLFLFMFHVDMMGRNCFLALLSILITGFQELLDLKDGCTLVFLFALLWLCRISDKQLKQEELLC